MIMLIQAILLVGSLISFSQDKDQFGVYGLVLFGLLVLVSYRKEIE